MSNGDQQPTLSPVPFLYEMVISFFDAARQTLDPVLQAIGGYENLGLLADGRPGPPDLVTRKLGELPPGDRARHLGACLSATIAPSQAAIDDALTFLDGRPPDIPLPHPDQGFEGEVGVYWDNRDAQVFAEATFEGDGTYAYFAVHGVPGAAVDKCGRDVADVAAPWPEDMLRILRNPDRA